MRLFVKGIVSKGKSGIKSRLGGIRGLWKHGISGDLPIVLMRVTHLEQLNGVRMLLNAAKYINMCNAGSCKTERDEFNEGSRTDERQEKLFDVVLIGNTRMNMRTLCGRRLRNCGRFAQPAYFCTNSN